MGDTNNTTQQDEKYLPENVSHNSLIQSKIQGDSLQAEPGFKL